MSYYFKRISILVAAFVAQAQDSTHTQEEVEELKDFEDRIIRDILKIDRVYLLVPNQDAGSIEYV